MYLWISVLDPGSILTGWLHWVVVLLVLFFPDELTGDMEPHWPLHVANSDVRLLQPKKMCGMMQTRPPPTY